MPKVSNRAKRPKLGIKSTTTAIYSGIFLLVITLVAIGYQPPKQVDSTVNASVPISSPTSATSQTSVDQIVATNIAAGIAQRAELPIAVSLANQVVTLTIQNQLAQQNDSSTITKPQIIQPTANSRAIRQYVVVEGDSVPSIAAQFGVSAETVKWANNLSGDAVSAGKELTILPVDGVLYTVKGGDSIDSLAAKFGVSTQDITTYNDLELSGLVAGDKIVIPSGVLPTTERPGYVAPRSIYSYDYSNYRFAGGYGGGSGYVVNPASYIPGVGLYDQTNAGYNGQCTWYVYWRRAAIGMPIPNAAHGDAARWNTSLARLFRVDTTPAYGAIVQNGGGAGHVGVVEALNADGSILISEMNNRGVPGGGEFRVNVRTIPASAVGNFNYIH